MEPVKIFVKCEESEPESSSVAAPAVALTVSVPGGAAGGYAAGGPAKRGVGRLVDSTQADDRRMIGLVRDRPLLFARSNLPVASYHSQVKKLWREVADIMGWTVADVRRKWSHIRNSYSRHLRNEIHGVRTGRGRAVSRWYLADELEYLREHMATDTRSCPLSMVPSVSSVKSFAPHFLSQQRAAGVAGSAGAAGHYLGAYSSEGVPVPEPVEPAVEVQSEEPGGEGAGGGSWYTAPSSDADGDTFSGYEPEDAASYFQFFRGIYKDYRELTPHHQRRFRRHCLVFLHGLLDRERESQEMGMTMEEGDMAVNLSAHHYSSDSDAETALPN